MNTLSDHEENLKRISRFYFDHLSKELEIEISKGKDGQPFMKRMEIDQLINDTKAIADKFPCLWDLVTEMESDLMSEVR